MVRGRLRVYLGAAPGVGKTYAMLDEGWRRHERGTDVVVGFVEAHGRPKTVAQLRDLEIVPRRRVEYRGSQFEEMDLDAVLARRPKVALVDEMAHTNVPGSRNEKRWQDIEALLAAGIDVISTVNIQHLDSLNDVVERIAGVVQRETVPDEAVRRADQIELVDMSPEALRRRMAHGNIYPPERVDAALANYFRPGNLAALRELALLWLADQVETGLQSYMDAHGIAEAWETRERVVVAITGRPGGDHLVRRAARMAARQHGELIGVHVVASDGLTTRSGEHLDEQRRLVGQLAGSYSEVVSEDVAAGLVGFARAEKATQLVLGATRHSRLDELVRGSIAGRVLRQAEGIDVHVISAHEDEASAELAVRPPPRRRDWVRRAAPLPLKRRLAGLVVAVIGLPALTAVLAAQRDSVSLATDLLLLLALAVLVAALGGVVLGAVAAVAASLLANWFLVEPVGTFSIAAPENSAGPRRVRGGVGHDRLLRRPQRRPLAGGAASPRRSGGPGPDDGDAAGGARPDRPAHRPDPRHVLLRLGLLLSRAADTWTLIASSGDTPPLTPFDDATWDLTVGPETVFVVKGGTVQADDERLLRTFVSQLAIALDSRRLQARAVAAESLADADALRTALLRAVSHDLRTPLASVKASVTSLMQHDVSWTDAERQVFLATIDTETDRLNTLVGDLLDMSRIQAGAVEVTSRAVYLEDVVAAALASVSCGQDPRIEVAVPETLPAVVCDPALLERVVANVVANAVAWSPLEAVVRIEAAEVGGRVHLRVIDRGRGLTPDERARAFEPFQRLGDRSNQAGVGLGLAVAHGFVQAMEGQIELDDTPGGGLTVSIALAAREEPGGRFSDATE